MLCSTAGSHQSRDYRTVRTGEFGPELSKLADERPIRRRNLLNALKRTRANETGLVRCAGSVHPPPPMPRWATALQFVIPRGCDFIDFSLEVTEFKRIFIPTGAKRSGGTCCFFSVHPI